MDVRIVKKYKNDIYLHVFAEGYAQSGYEMLNHRKGYLTQSGYEMPKYRKGYITLAGATHLKNNTKVFILTDGEAVTSKSGYGVLPESQFTSFKLS